MHLLTTGETHPKLSKSDAGGVYRSFILHLSPARLSGYNACPSASVGCSTACLNTAGRGNAHSVQRARLRKTLLFFEQREKFLTLLREDIETFHRRCKKNGFKTAVRLNGTSDIPWEQISPELFTAFADVQFYDYTKLYARMLRWCEGKLPHNYYLTFSRSESNQDKALTVLERGGNVAVVFDSKELPTRFFGYPVNNADETDLRFLDNFGVCGLYAKGRAKHDHSGFVIPTLSRKGKRYVDYAKLRKLS